MPKLVHRRTFHAAVLTAAIVIGFSSSAFGDDDDDRPWGITIWGLSYHVNKSIDYAADNWGLGLRYYVTRHFFVEGDALRNSNRGLVLPVSFGAELGIGTLFHACRVSAVGAATLAYYQNPRTGTNYYKVGPVPGVALSCGRFKTNVVGVLSPSSQPLAAVAASLTVLF
jgi:hypothetical protein